MSEAGVMAAAGVVPRVRRVDPDSDVLELVERGHVAAAFNRVMQRYGNAVYRYCSMELRDATLAEDVQQQVLIEAHRDLVRFRRKSMLRVWLFAIARNRVLDAAKKRRRRRDGLDEGAAAELPDPGPLAGESIDDARLRAALVESLTEIAEETRTALLLHYQQGFTFEEMSKICGEKAGTLSARVHRVLPQLRALIEARMGPLADDGSPR